MAIVIDHPSPPAPAEHPTESNGLPASPRTAGTAGDPAVRCRRCGNVIPTGTDHVISSHRTSTGRVTYLRCECSGVGIWILDQRAA